MTVLETETGYAARLANGLAISGTSAQAKRGARSVRCIAWLGDEGDCALPLAAPWRWQTFFDEGEVLGVLANEYVASLKHVSRS